MVFVTVKQIEQNQEDESSDSSDDNEDDDVTQIEAKPRGSRQFTFDVPDTNGSNENGHAPKRQQTKRRTKQKGYWQGFLSSMIEK